jgi:hypothetical protein
MIGKIVTAADGKQYREIEKSDGSFEYLEINDVQVHQQQVEESSHLDFFRNQKQKVRRPEALRRAIEQASVRVDPGIRSGVRAIKDEEFFRLNKMYQDAVAKGEHRQCPFQPLTTYQLKLGKIRPILAGEIGVYGDPDGNTAEILTLEMGYGKGQLVQVPAQLEGVKILSAGTIDGVSAGQIPTLEEIQAMYDAYDGGSYVSRTETGTAESTPSSVQGAVGGNGGVQSREDDIPLPTSTRIRDT